MDQETNPTQAAAAPLSASTGPSAGQMLRGAREARGVSLDELVSETRINRATLAALEADQKPPQDAAVFVRGYFKRCAKVLGVDENMLIQAYEARGGRAPAPPQPVTIQWNSRPEYTVKRPPSWFWPVVIAVAIFGGILWLVSALKDEAPATEPARSEAAPRAPRVVELTPRTVPQETVESAREPESASAEMPPAIAPETEGVPLLLQPAPSFEGGTTEAVATAPAAAEPVPGVPAGQHAIFMEFSAACWTVVVDNDDDRLLYGMFKAGDRKEVVGEPPYRVSLGYAPGVKLYYEGKPLDFSTKVNPGDTTARFVVPF